MSDIKKIGVVGCGFVGSTIAYTLMESEMFNEMALVDVNKSKARGEALDMSHCLPFLSQMQIYQSDYSGLENASIVVVAAGANQKEGETRLDLLSKNVKIFREVIGRITEVNCDCIILVVSNPVDILTYAALKLSGFDSKKVIGSGTVLDTARLKYLVGNRLSVDSRNVHSFIIGEHGDSASDYIILKNNNEEEAVMLREIYPRVRGIAIVCTGGDLPRIRETVTDLLSAAIGIPASKIQVAGM